MTQFKFDNARVRIHGTTDKEKLKASTLAFLKKAERNRKNEKKNNESTA